MSADRACNVCGGRTLLVQDRDLWWCTYHDPLQQLRTRMDQLRRLGDPFDPAWGALVDEEQDMLRRRGRNIYGALDRRFGG